MTHTYTTHATIDYYKNEEIEVALTPEEVEGLSEVEIKHLVEERAYEKMDLLIQQFLREVPGVVLNDYDGPRMR